MRIARILTRPNLGGPTRQVVALWREHRALGARTLLLVGRCGADEVGVDLAGEGIPELAPADVIADPDAADGFCVVPDLVRRVAPARDLWAFLGLRRILRAVRPDVVHTHTSKAGVLGRLAAPRTSVIAHTFHGLVLRDYAARAPSGFARRLERRLARRSDLLFAVSASCAAELRELGVASGVTVVPPAVATAAFRDADRADARARLGATDRPVIGFVGRLVAIKCPELFVAIARALPQVDAVVLGDGPLRPALERAAPSNLRFLGARSDVAGLVPGLDLLVLPSRREGFPVAAVEAAAAGVRTVGFEVPGLLDLDAFAGVARLVPPAAGVDGLVAAVRALLALGPPPVGPGGAALVRATAPAEVASALLASYRAAMERRA